MAMPRRTGVYDHGGMISDSKPENSTKTAPKQQKLLPSSLK